jgi:transcriptional regulator with XRE-family HTH domain
MNDIKSITGQRLRSARKVKNISVQEAAEYCGCSIQAISAYERGDRTPKLDRMIRLAELYEVQFEYLWVNTKTAEE